MAVLLIELVVDTIHGVERLGNGRRNPGGPLCAFLNTALCLPAIAVMHTKITGRSIEVCPNSDHIVFDNAVMWTAVLCPVIVRLAPFPIVGIVLAPL